MSISPAYKASMTPVLSQLINDIFKGRIHTKWDNPSMSSTKTKKVGVDPVDIGLWLKSIAGRGVVPNGKRPSTVKWFYQMLFTELNSILMYQTTAQLVLDLNVDVIKSLSITFNVDDLDSGTCTYIGKIPGREVYFFLRMGGWDYSGDDGKNVIPAYSLELYNLSTMAVISTDTKDSFQIYSGVQYGKIRDSIKKIYQAHKLNNR